MGRAGIEPATHGFSVPKQSRFQPQKCGFDDILILGNTWNNKATCVATQVPDFAHPTVQILRGIRHLQSSWMRIFPNSYWLGK
jgi:hypothetical protein